MPSTSITSLLWPAGDNARVQGEVFEAEATGTRYMLRGCKPNDNSCDHHTAFVEFGPWANKTLPSGAAETGVYDVHGTVDGTMYSSVCEMSRSVIEQCKVSKASGFGSSTEYSMTRTKGETGADFTLLYHEVTLTGGLSKLASATGDAAPLRLLPTTRLPQQTRLLPRPMLALMAQQACLLPQPRSRLLAPRPPLTGRLLRQMLPRRLPPGLHP